MKTPRELILARHQSAEAKLKTIRAEDLAACARSAAERGRDSLSPYNQARTAGDKLSPPLKAELDAALGPGRQRPPTFGLATAAVRFWREALWPWRRTWLGMAAIWVGILAFGLAARDTPRTASIRPPRPDPEVLAVLRGQKQLLAQLLGPGALPLVFQLQIPGPRSAAEPPPGRNGSTRGLKITLRPELYAQV